MSSTLYHPRSAFVTNTDNAFVKKLETEIAVMRSVY